MLPQKGLLMILRIYSMFNLGDLIAKLGSDNEALEQVMNLVPGMTTVIVLLTSVLPESL